MSRIYTREQIIDFLKRIIEYAAYIYIFFLPFGKSVVEIACGVIIGAFILKRIAERRFSLPITAWSIPLFIFLGALLLSLINTPDVLHSLRAFITKYLKFVIVLFAVSEVFDTEQKIKNMVKIAVLSIIAICLDGFIQYFLKFDLLHLPPYPIFKNTRITASFPYPNDFASWILIFILPTLGIFFFYRSSLRLKIGIAVLLLMQGIALLLTETRGAFLGVAIGIIFLLMVMKKYKVIFTFLLAMAIVVAVFLVKPDLFPANMASTDGIKDRKVMWTNAFTIYKRHPILGNGLNTFHTNYMEVREDEWKGKKGSYAHNCFLQMASEVGIVGLLAFLAFLSLFFKENTPSYSREKEVSHKFTKLLITSLLAGILAFLVNAFFDTSLYSLNLNALFWMSLAFTLSLKRLTINR